MIKLRGNERLLIVKMSSIGDVVHALPAASAMRRTYPELRISWLIEAPFTALVTGHPAIDRVIAVPSVTRGPLTHRLAAIRQAVRLVRGESYDAALELQGLMVSSLIALLAGAPVRVGRPRRREGAHLLTQRVPLPKGAHASEESLACAGFLGATPGPVRFDIPVAPAAAASIAHKLLELRIPPDAPLVVLNPSTAGAWKIWSAANWAVAAGELARDGSVVLVGSREERARHRQIAHEAGGRVHDLTGQTSLAELIAILDRCTLHIAGDTGSSHIAAALGRPVIGIFGPSDPRRVVPYGQEQFLLSGAHLCGRLCPHWCPSAHRCLRSITPDRVVAQARRAMAAARDQQIDATAQP